MSRRRAQAFVAALGLCATLAQAAGASPVTGAAVEDRLCTAQPIAAAPAAVALQGCERAACTTVGDERLCACERPDGSTWAQRWRGAQRLQQWPTEIAPMTGLAAFVVLQADLDGDERPEWLLLRDNGSSNGLGVSYQNLCVLWPQQARRAPLCRDISEWDALTLLVHEPARRGCSLMDSVWQPGREPGRREGTYAVGRLQRLQAGRWQAVPPRERLPVARRLLNSFADERETLPQRNAERLWYQHPAAITVPCPGPMCRAPAP